MRYYSKKRQKINREYRKGVQKFLSEGTECEINSPVCIGEIQGTHHVKGRIGKNLMDKRFWLRSCNPCNQYCEQHPEWARENGKAKSRLAI